MQVYLSAIRSFEALVLLAGLLLALILGAISIQRLAVYQDEVALWKDNVLHQPNDAIARNNLARALSDLGRTEEAIEQFAAALQVNPNVPEIQYNLGNALL